MERRQRLSRSRDFDAVYRRGRSVSTRYLTVRWFQRPDDADSPPRLGLAVPRSVGGATVRNRVKRQLREAWAATVTSAAAGSDVVLVARPGLAEAAEARGSEWLAGQVREALAKVAP